jgi:hypothetical protein
LPDLAPSAAERLAASWQGSMLDGEDGAMTYPAVRALTIRQPPPSRWAQAHRFHWIFQFPAPVDPPVRCSGMPGLWRPPHAAAEAVADLL